MSNIEQGIMNVEGYMKRNGYRTKYHFVLQAEVVEGIIY